jgi:hypothetical protein
MKKTLASFMLSAVAALFFSLVSVNASADGHVGSTYGKVVTSTGSCVKGSGKTLC